MKKDNQYNYYYQFLNKTKKRVIIGTAIDIRGKAIVTTGIPVQTKPNSISHVKVKTMSYEDYMLNKHQRTR